MPNCTCWHQLRSYTWEFMPLIPYHSRVNSVYYGILFSHEGEKYPAICPNVVGSENIMLSEISQRLWLPFYVESLGKKKKLPSNLYRELVTDRWLREVYALSMWRWLKGTSFQLWSLSPGDIIYNMLTIVNLRSQEKRKKTDLTTMCNNKHLDLWSFWNICKFQIILMYAWNYYVEYNSIKK